MTPQIAKTTIQMNSPASLQMNSPTPIQMNSPAPIQMNSPGSTPKSRQMNSPAATPNPPPSGDVLNRSPSVGKYLEEVFFSSYSDGLGYCFIGIYYQTFE